MKTQKKPLKRRTIVKDGRNWLLLYRERLLVYKTRLLVYKTRLLVYKRE